VPLSLEHSRKLNNSSNSEYHQYSIPTDFLGNQIYDSLTIVVGVLFTVALAYDCVFVKLIAVTV
jgi:hypothetical protein